MLEEHFLLLKLNQSFANTDCVKKIFSLGKQVGAWNPPPGNASSLYNWIASVLSDRTLSMGKSVSNYIRLSSLEYPKGRSFGYNCYCSTSMTYTGRLVRCSETIS